MVAIARRMILASQNTERSNWTNILKQEGETADVEQTSPKERAPQHCTGARALISFLLDGHLTESAEGQSKNMCSSRSQYSTCHTLWRDMCCVYLGRRWFDWPK